MTCLGQEVWSRADFLLGTDHGLFWNVSVQEMSHKSDHYIILGCLHTATLREHTQYLRRYNRFPLLPLGKPTREDNIFVDLCQPLPKIPVQKARCNAWISSTTWRLVNTRVSMCRDPTKYHQMICSLGRHIWASLQEDHHQWVETAGTAIEPLLTYSLHLVKEVCTRMN